MIAIPPKVKTVQNVNHPAESSLSCLARVLSSFEGCWLSVPCEVLLIGFSVLGNPAAGYRNLYRWKIVGPQ